MSEKELSKKESEKVYEEEFKRMVLDSSTWVKEELKLQPKEKFKEIQEVYLNHRSNIIRRQFPKSSKWLEEELKLQPKEKHKKIKKIYKKERNKIKNKRKNKKEEREFFK